MDTTRLETLRKMLEAEPNDSFTRYALGLEYVSLNETDAAQEVFEELRTLDPNYVAVYYQLGKVYERQGDEMTARKIYEKGLYVATSQNDMHTKDELQQAMDDLL